MSDVIAPFLAATIRTATPLALAALGEVIVERAGLINIGLEGAILAGAFGALVGATGAGVAGGFAGAMVGGVLIAILFAVFAIGLRADQIITGTALTLLSVGTTGTLYRALYGSSGAALALPTSAPFAIPGLSRLPLVGAALFAQPPITYVMYLLVPSIAWWMAGTHGGLSLRAIGEKPDAARAAGISVARVRVLAILAGGVLGGLAGGTLVLAQAGTFAEGMSSGRGFIAIAIVVLGRWQPLGVALAALVFGGASALQFAFQAMGWHAPYQLFLALPYLLTLAGLASAAGRGRAPASLGKS
ncbi:MAG: ABC-type transporter, integral rane subunit [Gemmatimonadetes bacterium]|nr:ABC-type transporter, integral rane subunit [Gemmatimonadota bacterium]